MSSTCTTSRPQIYKSAQYATCESIDLISHARTQHPPKSAIKSIHETHTLITKLPTEIKHCVRLRGIGANDLEMIGLENILKDCGAPHPLGPPFLSLDSEPMRMATTFLYLYSGLEFSPESGQGVEVLGAFQHLDARQMPSSNHQDVFYSYVPPSFFVFSNVGYNRIPLYRRVTNYVAFIGFTILVWDHLITFKDEVRYIWNGRKSIVIYLFFWVRKDWCILLRFDSRRLTRTEQNRYFTPFSFIGNFIAYFSTWSPEGTLCFSVRALYADRPKVVYSLGVVLLAEAGVFAWLLSRAEAVPHTLDVHGYSNTACTMIFDPQLGSAPSLSAWFPLVYDTIVIALTLWKCAGPVKEHTASHILRTLLKDGLLYYSVIFAVNLVLAVMIISTRPGIKNITAQLEQLLTVAMMSRITLSLRRKAHEDPSSDEGDDSYLFPRSPESRSFHVYTGHGHPHHHSHYSDKPSQHWIENASATSGRSHASSSWRRCPGNFGLSYESFDSDPVLHSETPPITMARGVQSGYQVRPGRSIDAFDTTRTRSQGMVSGMVDDHLQTKSMGALELGTTGVGQPERAVLSDRDVYELRRMRASPYVRT
ncbi:uncharacterized protein FOMMEDRAFT_171078 [Fomitiporia mediterranea MF3/22]|uniref:uncharacterized protein n=1 Tax=Fomitiporia mediterranea (strain MF3/22) TaxID=694068 RepID=UPI00044082DE|nr:uncharacterized protein FOMMEDRAFT_171078 [Fomitiporia mediterranea MF3/22]EJC98458.1 hypothetical protein FOMMEDRAFT_171078 [Fomitiporia mediterranea MF3/22]